jgi:hypothetical protein
MINSNPPTPGECFCALNAHPLGSPADLICPRGFKCEWLERTPLTVDEVWLQFAAKSADFLAKARQGSGRRYRVDDDPIFECLAGLRDRLAVCLASDVRARAFAAFLLFKGLTAIRSADPLVHFYFVTVLHSGWLTSDEVTHVRLEKMFDEVRPFLSSLTGNYVAIGEVQAFANVKHEEGGKVLTIHPHVIVWGRRAVNSETAGLPWARSFQAISPEVSPIEITPIGLSELDLVRTARYPLKAPCRSKTKYRHPTTGAENLHESEANDRYIRFHRVFEILSRINLSRLFDAAGDGEEILDRLGDEMRAWARAMAGQAPVTVDQISDYWTRHRGGRRGQHRFRPPNIS